MKRTTNEIESAVAKRAAVETEIASSKKRLAEGEARIPALASAVNLDSPTEMAELGRLHLEVGILPARISGKESEFQKTESEILALCEDFISHVLSPKVRELEGRARAITRAVLKNHIRAGDELDRAVDTATLVREIGDQRLSLESNPIGGPVGYAHRVMEAWGAVEALEAKVK
jgi:hypothetical protein